ncbi:hypothetical protein GCM10011498_14960 [Amylibacter cionae]|uniref:Uncharacterized protein n=1 Tax=Neptunicoccus cionae TaxID=2035344 RepID=A0A916VPF9_9RHOB|nr:hypothetical protein GCM10011498_14960 [Amylibacter cionae]
MRWPFSLEARDQSRFLRTPSNTRMAGNPETRPFSGVFFRLYKELTLAVNGGFLHHSLIGSRFDLGDFFGDNRPDRAGHDNRRL